MFYKVWILQRCAFFTSVHKNTQLVLDRFYSTVCQKNYKFYLAEVVRAVFKDFTALTMRGEKTLKKIMILKN